MATFTSKTKNTATFTSAERSDTRYLITTDTPDSVLVGENEDEVLIWNGTTVWINLTKN